MSRYSTVTVIFNPQSTGPSASAAASLADNLQTKLPGVAVVARPTQYAGHAEELAYEAARASSKPLIISASGDGGYNEVVNGIMRAQREGATPVASLLPAGNANDHFNDVYGEDLVQSIVKEKTKRIDVLKMTAGARTRYAHSYVGVGLTPEIAMDLNKTRLNFFKEVYISAKTLLSFRPVRLNIDGKVRVYDSVICSNISRMAKFMTLSRTAQPDDGKFEVILFPSQGKLKLYGHLLRASTVGLRQNSQVEQFTFKTTKPTPIQLDGEVMKLPGKTQVKISTEKRALTCVA